MTVFPGDRSLRGRRWGWRPCFSGNFLLSSLLNDTSCVWNFGFWLVDSYLFLAFGLMVNSLFFEFVDGLLFWLVWDFEALTGFGLVWFNGIWIVGYWFVSLNGLLVFGCWSLLQVFDPVFGYGFLECWYWDVGLQFAGLMVLIWFWHFWIFFWFFEFEMFYRLDEFYRFVDFFTVETFCYFNRLQVWYLWDAWDIWFLVLFDSIFDLRFVFCWLGTRLGIFWQLRLWFDSFENWRFSLVCWVWWSFLSPSAWEFYCYISVASVEFLFKKGGKQRNWIFCYVVPLAFWWQFCFLAASMQLWQSRQQGCASLGDFFPLFSLNDPKSQLLFCLFLKSLQ